MTPLTRTTSRWGFPVVLGESFTSFTIAGFAIRVTRRSLLCSATLAEVQEATGVHFAMPDQLSEAEAAELVRAAKLVAGDTIAGTWSTAEVVLDREVFELLTEQNAPYGSRLEILVPIEIEIAGRSISLGHGLYVLSAVQIVESSESESTAGSEVVVELGPGSTDRFEVRLSPSGLPLDIIEPVAPESIASLAGYWVAEQSSQIVASSIERSDVLRQAQDLAGRVSVWRVPTDTTAAESMVLEG